MPAATHLPLSPAALDRAHGVLLATAAGDALGVPYEFATPPAPGVLAEMTGGGLGNFAPGEWSDDTSMAVAIAEVAATGADLTDPRGARRHRRRLPALVRRRPGRHRDPDAARCWARPGGGWMRGRRHAGQVMAQEALAYARDHPHSAGNGALMRTAPVALAHLHDRDALAQAARLVAALTHADPLAGDSCVLWCEAIRVAVLEERLDVRAGLDLARRRRPRAVDWVARRRAASAVDGAVPGARFNPNGFTVTALQAAVAAITGTPVPSDQPDHHLQDALHNAVRIGNDTDTVAAIAGGLLGARWGAAAVPGAWRRAVHGWPGLTGDDLLTLADRTVGERAGSRTHPER